MQKYLHMSEKSCIFASQNAKYITTMACPIAPTPALSGQAAIDFLTSISNSQTESASEKERVFAGAERIRQMLTFNF
mgnify:CR=1 FL=1